MIVTRFILLFISQLVFINQVAAGFHFYLEPGVEKCFNKELMKHSLLQIKFKIDAQQEKEGQYINIDLQTQDLSLYFTVEELFDDNHKVASQLGSKTGDFSFTAFDSGEHHICMKPVSGGYKVDARTRITIDMEVGDGKTIFGGINREQEQTIETRVKQLMAELRELRTDYRLIREREVKFRDLSESVNVTVVRWVIVQCIILGCICYWQLKDLSRFFVKQKVI